jgi:prophage DNA circulation protein
MSWRDSLRPASWRGIPFLVDSADYSTGRRYKNHEYPQRDKPYIEDLGQETGVRKIQGRICAHPTNNNDPWPNRDALIQAIRNTPGKGTLVHPYYGDLLGHVVHIEIKESGTQAGGWVDFDLTFIEAGEVDFRAIAVLDTKGIAQDSAKRSYDAAVQDFSGQYEVAGFQAFVLEDVVLALDAIRVAVAQAKYLLSLDAQKALLLLRQVGGPTVQTGFEIGDAITRLIREVQRPISLHTFARPPIPGFNTVGRNQQRINSSALVNLVHVAAATRQAELSVDLVAQSPRYASDDSTLRGIPQLITRAEMQEYRRSLSSVITSTVSDLSDQRTFDASRQALIQLRADAVQHMTTDGEHLARTFDTSCCEGTGFQKAMPSTVLAYRYYGTLTHDVIELRNNLPSPLFIPPHARVELLALDQ